MKGLVCPECDKSGIYKSKQKRKWYCYQCVKFIKKPKERIVRDYVIKRDPKKLPMISRTELLKIIHQCEDLRAAAYISFLFLTACRVSEPQKLKAKNFEMEIIKSHKFLVIRNLATLKKRKGIEYRDQYIHYKTEKPFIDILNRYLKTCWEEEIPFFWSRVEGFRIVQRNTRGVFKDQKRDWLSPHYFRHLRNTDLLNTYENIGPEDLLVFNNWSNMTPASIYVHKASKDVARKMIPKH